MVSFKRCASKIWRSSVRSSPSPWKRRKTTLIRNFLRKGHVRVNQTRSFGNIKMISISFYCSILTDAFPKRSITRKILRRVPKYEDLMTQIFKEGWYATKKIIKFKLIKKFKLSLRILSQPKNQMLYQKSSKRP